ncbi:MAG TPA: hypothetical protein VG206_14910 [Terriglobia bacterium]|nr:hypothetical protein [Terriglobia bacterium]
MTFLLGDRFHTVRSAEPTGFTSVTGLIVARKGDFWLSTGSGIVHIPGSEVEKVIRHPERKVIFELFDLVSDLHELLRPNDIVYAPGAIRADDGTVWFARRNGAVRIEPAHIYRNSSAGLDWIHQR